MSFPLIAAAILYTSAMQDYGSLGFDMSNPVPYYSRSSTTTTSNPDWMAQVPDKASLATLTIPGTHASGARYGGDAYACQSLPIADQLTAGIRFLDIHLYQTGEKLNVKHGAGTGRFSLGDVLDTCKSFLKKHSAECIMLRAYKDSGMDATTGSWSSALGDYLTSSSYKSYWYTGTDVPRLGDVRGKIVLLCEERDVPGINWVGLNVQNETSVPTIFARSKKWDKIEAQLEFASSAGLWAVRGQDVTRSTSNGGTTTTYSPHIVCTANLVINFVSGSSSGAYPNAVAIYEDEKLYRYIKTRARWGCIMMDYPGGDLITNLIKTNFKSSGKVTIGNKGVVYDASQY